MQSYRFLVKPAKLFYPEIIPNKNPLIQKSRIFNGYMTKAVKAMCKWALKQNGGSVFRDCLASFYLQNKSQTASTHPDKSGAKKYNHVSAILPG